jgi:two-component system, NarL family, nitrate/nitrite response regulator NarL
MPNWVPRMVEAITFAAVDEHPIFRQGLIQSLQRAEGLSCLAEGETAADARRIAALQKPDILVLEIFIRGGGIEAARGILSAHPSTKVLILTASDDEVHLTQALRAGVRGYVLKGVSGGELVRIIRQVHAGQPYIDPALSAQLLVSNSLEPPAAVSAHAELSHREQQVLAGVCRGLTDKEIADTLHIKPSTIRYYLTQIFKKLKVHNRVQALKMSREFLKT